jgi:hypothetical protein
MNNKQVDVQHCLPAATTPCPELVRFCPTLSVPQFCCDQTYLSFHSAEDKAIVWVPAYRGLC